MSSSFVMSSVRVFDVSDNSFTGRSRGTSRRSNCKSGNVGRWVGRYLVGWLAVSDFEPRDILYELLGT